MAKKILNFLTLAGLALVMSVGVFYALVNPQLSQKDHTLNVIASKVSYNDDELNKVKEVVKDGQIVQAPAEAGLPGNAVKLQTAPTVPQEGNIDVAGTIFAASFSGSGALLTNISADTANTAVSANYAQNSDKLDGYHFSSFAWSVHGHTESDIANLTADLSSKLNLSGGTMVGNITWNGTQTFGNATIFNLDTLVGGGVTNLHAHAIGGPYVLLQGTTPGAQETGNINIDGTIIAGFFSGNGSSLTNVNAAQLGSQLPSYYTNADNVSSGTLSTNRYSAYTDLGAEGKLGSGGGLDADMVDGSHSTAFQPIDSTLTALAGYNTNGLLTQTAPDTFTGRTITGTLNRLSVSNGDGVLGNPTIDIDANYTGQTSITTLGTIATGTWNAGSVTSSGNINTTAGAIQTNSIARIDNSGNLLSIGTTQLNTQTYTWPGAQTASGFLQTNGTGTLSWTTTVPATSVPFSGITGATNTSASMVVGTGSSLGYTGSGTINASSLIGSTWAIPGAIGAGTPSTGAFTTLSANNGLTVSAAGASITGGLNNNNGGITNTGAISQATTISASGDVATSAGNFNAATGEYKVGGTTVINNALSIINVVNVTASGTVQANNLTATSAVSGNTVSATGAVSGGSVSATGTVSGGSVSATGNVTTTAGNVNISSANTVYLGGVGGFPAISGRDEFGTAGHLRFIADDSGGAKSFLFQRYSDTTNVGTLDTNGNLVVIGTVTASGGGSANWNTAYTHSQATSNVHGLTFTGEGAGGGLDSDTVDGSHASAFQAAGSYVNLQGSTPGTPQTGHLNISGTGIMGTLTVSAGGASITGGANLNAGGITNAGTIAGTTTISGTGAITVQPAAGSNLNISLSGTGDLAVNTNQLYVDTDTGRVGIGTTAPGQKLEIYGTGAKLRFNTTVGAYDLYGDDSYGLRTNTGLFIGNTDLGLNIGNDIRLYRNAADVLRTSDSLIVDGIVGIGDTTPDGKLDVESTGAVTTSNYGINLSNLTTNVTTDGINKYGAYITSTGSFTGGAGAATNNYGLYVDTVSGADNNYGAYIAGNTGIGTAPNATYMLDVGGNIRTVGGNFYFTTNNDVRWGDSTTYIRGSGSGAGGYLSFVTNSNQGLYQNNLGNVGIGTTSPTRLLGLGGDAARGMGMERGTVANTVGYNLTVNAGGATSGATDKNGGALVLSSGLSTGTGTGQIQLWTSPALTTGGISTISATPTFGGTGYTAADVLTVTTGGTGGTVTVATVDGSGVILTLNTAPVTPGSNYTTGTGKATTGGTGTGATVNITAITSTADSALAQRMTILGNGNVGIGTTNPAVKLTIGSNVNEYSPVLRTYYYTPGLPDNYYGEMGHYGASSGVQSLGGLQIVSQSVADDTSAKIVFAKRVGTTSTAQMVILNNGNVGIGTTSPSKALEVSSATGGGIRYSLSSQPADYYTDFLTTVFGAADVGIQVNQNVNGSIRTGVMSIRNGNVGIGTTSPQRNLHVADNNIAYLRLDRPFWNGPGSGAGSLEFAQHNASSINVVSANITAAMPTGTNGAESTYLDFSTRLSGTLASRLRISENGNVGIGTVSPAANLTVAQGTSGPGTVATNGTITLTGTGTTFTNTLKVGDTITVSGETVRTIATIPSDVSLTATVAFSTTASGLTYTLTGGTRLVVQGNGNVGIGTASPTKLLEVNGTSKFNGHLTVAAGARIYLDNYSWESYQGTLGFYTTDDNNVSITKANSNSTINAISNTDPHLYISSAATYPNSQYITLFHNQTDAVIQSGSGNINLTPAGNVIVTTGNVGIGTTNPAYKLDVNGTLNATTLYQGGQTLDDRYISTTQPNNLIPNSRFLDSASSTSAFGWTGFSSGKREVVDATINTQTGLTVDQWDNSAWTTSNPYVWMTDANISFADTYLVGKYVVFSGNPTAGLANYKAKIVETDIPNNRVRLSIPVGYQNVPGIPTTPTVGEQYNIAAVANRSTKAVGFYANQANYGNVVYTDYFTIPGNEKTTISIDQYIKGLTTGGHYVQFEVTDEFGKLVYRWSGPGSTSSNTNNWEIKTFSALGPFNNTANWGAAEVGAKVTPTFKLRVMLKYYDSSSASDWYVTGIVVNAGEKPYAYSPHGISEEDNARLKNNLSIGGTFALGLTATTLGKLQIADSTTTAGYSGLRVDQTGAVTGTGYGGYFAKTGASTTNVGLYASASGATGNNYAAIFENGNVGIGTTSPSTKLHVSSSGSTYERIESTGADGNYAALSLKGGGTNAYWSMFTNSSALGGAVDNLAFYKETGTSGVKMVITDAGNVGIGTTSPSQLLHISGNTSGTLGIKVQQLGSAGAADTTTINDLGNQSQFGITGSTYTPYLSLLANSGYNYTTAPYLNLFVNNVAGVLQFSTGTTEKMRITAAGNVGIGTTNPLFKLSTSSGITNTDTGSTTIAGFTSLSTDTNPLGLFIKHSYGGSRYHIEMIGSRYGASGEDIDINDTMTLRYGGNVGIGTTSPVGKLDIVGSQNFSAFSAPGALTAGTPTAGGLCTPGTHSYKVTFMSVGGGETTGGTTSNQITCVLTTGQTVPLSAIPLGPTGTIGRKIYRTNAGDVGTYYLVITINDNTTTTSSDTTADNTTTAAPASNTTAVANIQTGGTTRMTINSSGNVGIGTTGPAGQFSLGSGTYQSVLATSQAEGLAGADLRIGLDETNRSLIIADRGDIGNDFGLTAQSNPSLMLYDATGTNYLKLSHDANYGHIATSSSDGIIFDSNFRLPANVYPQTSSGTWFDENYPGTNIVRFGNGTQRTITADKNYSSILIKRNLTGAFIESGSLLRLWKDDSGTSTYNSNFLEWGRGSTYTGLGVIDKSGNVGIGTTTPGAKLDVTPTVTATADLKGMNSGLVYNGASAMTNYYGHYIAAPTGTGTITNKYALVTEAGAGNVGIGTTSPSETLEVQSTTNALIGLDSATGNSAEIRFRENGVVKSYVWMSPSAGYTAIGGGSGSNSLFVMNSTGRVGIGVTNPGTSLAVAGLTGTASYNYVMVNTATGDFYYNSSSARYKENIQDFSDNFSNILNLQPKSFTDKASGMNEIGYIAEDLHNLGLDNLVIFKDGVPDAIKYDKIPLYMLGVMKEQQGQIGGLNTSVAGLNTGLGTMSGDLTNLNTTVGNLGLSMNTLNSTVSGLQSTVSGLSSSSSSGSVETFSSDQDLQAGEVVSVMRGEYKKVIRSNQDTDKAIVGVVSSSPSTGSTSSLQAGSGYKITYSGKAQAKVSVSKGAILAGDLLTTSAATPGVAVKSVSGSGGVVGVALQSTSSDGTIEIMVRTGYYPSTSSGSSTDSTSSLSSTGPILTAEQSGVLAQFTLSSDGKTLIVKGDLEIGGKLKIKEGAGKTIGSDKFENSNSIKILNTNVTTNSKILFSPTAQPAGKWFVSEKVPRESFTITSDAVETATFDWWIIN